MKKRIGFISMPKFLRICVGKHGIKIDFMRSDLFTRE